MMTDLNLAVIGNCSFGALIDRDGRLTWACLPRFDSDPTFCSLLSDGEPDKGFFDVVMQNCVGSEQHYLHNTAVLVTTLRDGKGGAVEITDFAPRYRRLERIFRPTLMVRMIRPVEGHPCITIRLRPAHSYGQSRPETTRGSNHIRYVMPGLTLRCTTSSSISYLQEEIPFLLEEPITMLIGADEPLAAPILDTGRDFLEHTINYWQNWSRFLSVPFEWQKAVIRAAITLKLCNFEETGAIIAAMTTSIPEAPDSGRNWDYRYCWLRDGYFVVQALNRLGATKTMEGYIQYVTNIVAHTDGEGLQPVYGITLNRRLVETEVGTLPGYRGMGPVRHGNQAYEHIQNDVYGSVILAATQIFFDERLTRRGDIHLFERLEIVGQRCVELYDKPGAGLWELRTKVRIHTYSSVMCWAGVDRLSKIAERLNLVEKAAFWRGRADAMKRKILDNAFDVKQNSFVESWGGDHLDGSLLLLLELGFTSATDPRFKGTVEAVGRQLMHGKHLFRYTVEDDFGRPEISFIICTFWYIDALAALGRREQARELFENMLNSRNHLGLLSEDIDPDTGELWGNFPQTYSMVGLINCAMNLSKSWKDAF